jgi:hypothetical protein
MTHWHGNTDAFWNISEQELAKLIFLFAESESAYRSALRARVRGFWGGFFNYDDFVDGFSADIREGIVRAWEDGTAECGISASEWSLEEVRALQTFIGEQVMQVGFFAIAIEQNTKALGGKLGPLFQRTELWVNRYSEAKFQAAAMACGNRKKVWVLGPTEKHCESCGGFESRVYRYSTWLDNGALPRSRRLACGGYR